MASDHVAPAPSATMDAPPMRTCRRFIIVVLGLPKFGTKGAITRQPMLYFQRLYRILIKDLVSES